MSVLVIGASRGIGLELVRHARGEGLPVTATVRDDAAAARLAQEGAQTLMLDVTDASQCAGLAAQLDGAAFVEVWLVAGVYGPRTRGLQPPSDAAFDQVMHTNVLAAMRLLPAMAPALAPDARVGVLSSRMGSMGLRGSNDGWLYRASKAALNSVVKDVSIAWRGRALCVALHPGWVRTDMGGASADLAAPASAAALRTTLANLPPSGSGGFYNHDGQALAW